MQSDIDIHNQSNSLFQYPTASNSTLQIKQPQINKIENRWFPWSPTVQAGIERECTKSDFSHDLENCVGKGSFGEVYKVTHHATGKPYAIKVLDKRQIIDTKSIHWVKHEIEILYKLNHPHIIKLINHFEDSNKIYLIMPYVSKGQLYKHLKRQSRFDERTASQYVLETIDAISYLHSFHPRIIHRDIKPENILLNNDFRIWLTDFGWADYENVIAEGNVICGTKEYMAPEVLKGMPYNYTVDIWAIGVLLFEWWAGFTPFAGNNQTELISNIKKWKISWPRDFPPWAKNLISKIWKWNASERWSWDEIKKHAWFTKNKEFRPMIERTPITEKEKIESHFINVNPEDVRKEVNDYLNPKKELISSSIIKNKKCSSNKSICTSHHSSERTSSNNTNNTNTSSLWWNFTEKANEINELKAKLSNHLNTIIKLENNWTLLQNENLSWQEKTRDDKEGYEKVIIDKSSVIAAWEEKVATWQENISKLQCDNLTLTLKNNSLYSSMNIWMEHNKKQEATILDLYRQINELNSKKEEIKTKLENENNLLKTQVETLAKEAPEIGGVSIEIIPIWNMIDLLTKSWLDIKQNFYCKLGKTDAWWYQIKEKQKLLQEDHRQEIVKQMSAFNDVWYHYKDEWKYVIDRTIDDITKEKTKAQSGWIQWWKDENKTWKERLLSETKRGDYCDTWEKDNELWKTKQISLLQELESRDKLELWYTEREKDSHWQWMELKYKMQNWKQCANDELSNVSKYNELLNMINDL